MSHLSAPAATASPREGSRRSSFRPRARPTALGPGAYCSGKSQAKSGRVGGLRTAAPTPLLSEDYRQLPARRLAAEARRVRVPLRGWACAAKGRAG